MQPIPIIFIWGRERVSLINWGRSQGSIPSRRSPNSTIIITWWVLFCVFAWRERLLIVSISVFKLMSTFWTIDSAWLKGVRKRTKGIDIESVSRFKKIVAAIDFENYGGVFDSVFTENEKQYYPLVHLEFLPQLQQVN